MAESAYNVKPEGMIVTRGNPPIKAEKELTAAAKPGMLLEIDGNDYKVKPEEGTNRPVGWAGFEHTHYNSRPDTYETAYEVGDTVTVVAGTGFEIYALATGEPSTGADVAISAGDLLEQNGDGTLTPWDADGGKLPVAIALETIAIPKATGATGDVVRIHVESLI